MEQVRSSQVKENTLQAIGNTPLVKLNAVDPKHRPCPPDINSFWVRPLPSVATVAGRWWLERRAGRRASQPASPISRKLKPASGGSNPGRGNPSTKWTPVGKRSAILTHLRGTEPAQLTYLVGRLGPAIPIRHYEHSIEPLTIDYTSSIPFGIAGSTGCA